MSSSNPLVTVGMPVFNGEQYISEAIESILNQSIRNFELIISDNSSTDSTTDICLSYAKKDSRIVFIRQALNIGAPQNYNFVFSQSKGIYFKWASANDICHPQMFEKCVSVLEERKEIVVSYPGTKFIDSGGKLIREYIDFNDFQSNSATERFKTLLLRMDFNNAQNGFFRSNILKKTGLERECEDGDIVLMAELLLYGKFFKFPDFLFFRRIAPGAITCERDQVEKRRFNAPNFNRWLYLPMLQFYLGLFKAVIRSPLNHQDKCKLYYFLTKKLNWDKKVLSKQVKDSISESGIRLKKKLYN